MANLLYKREVESYPRLQFSTRQKKVQPFGLTKKNAILPPLISGKTRYNALNATLIKYIIRAIFISLTLKNYWYFFCVSLDSSTGSS